jgi:hypothetical protein
MAIVAGRPVGAVSGAHITNFSTTAGQKSIAQPAKKLPVNSAVVFVVAIVIIVLYLEKG